MKFAVIDCNENAMVPDHGRGQGFIQALSGWEVGRDYEFVRFDAVSSRQQELLQCNGLILSGSRFDLAQPNGEVNRECYRMMIPVFRLIRDFSKPVLGICFGHQLLALGDEFDPERTAFGRLKIRNMDHPRDRHQVALVSMNGPLRFMGQRNLWVQFNHRQEVLRNEGLSEYYEVVAGSDRCGVEIMQHRSRQWFGVQFHPEIGKGTQDGEKARHADAEKDGQAILQGFVRHSLDLRTLNGLKPAPTCS